MRVRLPSLLVGALAALVVPAAGIVAAADLGARQPAPLPYAAPVQPYSIVSELRLGGSVQDPGSAEAGTNNINGEILFGKPRLFQDTFWQAFVPFPTAGGSYNFGGRTSYAYIGATWRAEIFPTLLDNRVFLEGFFGGAAHDGDVGPKSEINQTLNALGCNPLFREAAALGFRITERISIMATVEHMSNAGLCVNNRGLTNFGGKIGYRF